MQDVKMADQVARHENAKPKMTDIFQYYCYIFFRKQYELHNYETQNKD